MAAAADPERRQQQLLLAIDQGTTSTRAIVFDTDGQIRSVAQRELPQIYPAPGWVEHDADEIWNATVAVCREALAAGRLKAADILSIGIANQRETTVIWERRTGRPIHNAVVWQDRRTADLCDGLVEAGYSPLVQVRTGLLIDPYFSATKISWILDRVDGAREAAERGELAFGTIDSFLLWRLTGGAVHATDATNAARTMLFDVVRQQWDDDLLRLFRVPRALLPAVLDNAADFGVALPDLLGGPVPIGGMAGDQQAAAVGQGCFAPGMIKSTYGTGCFAVCQTGSTLVASTHRLLGTLCYRLYGTPAYALEGSIFTAGAAVQWLRDGLKLIGTASETEELASSIADTGGVYLVPAFTGLGAPHWDSAARGAILGLTRNTSIAAVVRATLEAVCYQTRDLMLAMEKDGAARPTALRVDGGMVANDWLLQFLADILDLPVERPVITETTALGAAFLAGLQAGAYQSLDEIAARWRSDKVFTPRMDPARREALYRGWLDAVARTRGHAIRTGADGAGAE